MTTASLTAADEHVRNAVLQQLERAPELDDSVINIIVDDGVVTLTGVIDSQAGKRAAERLAKRVRGVLAVANDLTVQAKVDWTEADVAADAQAVRLRPILQRMFR